MKNRLFIRLPDNTDKPVLWMLWHSDEKRWIDQGELLSVDLVALADMAQNIEVVAIAPASQVAMKEIKTPARQLKQIQRAVPYMLEDQLANSVDELHFAYGKRTRSGEIDVCWISKDLLDSWLAWFNQAEIEVDAIVSETALLERSGDAIEVFLHDDLATVNTPNEPPWECQRDLLDSLLEFDESTDAIRMFYTDQIEDHWQNNQLVIAQQISQIEWYQRLVTHYQRATLNLLQGPYQVKKNSELPWKKLRPIAIAASITLVFYLALMGTQYYQLQQENQALEQQAKSLFSRVFGSRPRAGSLLGQAERRLRRGGDVETQGVFLSLLNQTAAQITSVENIQPTAITFDGRKQEIRIDVLAPDYQALNNFRDNLVNSGLNVEMSAASAQGDKSSTRLVIRSGS